MSVDLLGKEILVALAGVGAGQVSQLYGYNQINRRRERMFQTHPADTVSNTSPRFRERVLSLHSLLSSLAALAIFNGLSLQKATVFPESGPVQATVNQDFGYQLAKGPNGYILSTTDPAAVIEDEVGDNLLSKVANLHMTAVSNNQVISINTPSQLNSIPPYGNGAYLQTEVANLMASGFIGAPKAQTNLLTNENAAVSGAMVVIDDGAPIGNIQASGDPRHIPLYIANINSSNSTPAVTSSLESAAKFTRGHYWSVNASNEASVANQIAADVHVNGMSNNEFGSGNIALLAIGAGLVAAELAYTRKQIASLAIN